MAQALFYICLLIFFIDSIIGFIHRQSMDKATKIFHLLIVTSLVSEIIGAIVEAKLQTKAPVYHIFSIVELFLYLLFFLQTIQLKVKGFIILFLAAASCTLGLGNLYFFQPLKEYNTNMLMIECLLIICMALYSLYKLFLRESLIDVVHHPHFRIWVAILILWSSTFFFWAFLNYLRQQKSTYYEYIEIGQILINIAVYIYIGFTFHGIRKNVES